jgi:hypothetical protein
LLVDSSDVRNVDEKVSKQRYGGPEKTLRNIQRRGGEAEAKDTYDLMICSVRDLTSAQPETSY